MLNKFKTLKLKYLVFLLIFLFSFQFFILTSLAAGAVAADPLNPTADKALNDQVKAFQTTSGLSSTASVDTVIAGLIQGFLALLGIIFVILILLAGYNWMTAAGEEEKVTKAMNTMRRAVIGLIIIVSAYAITYFVFKYLG